MFGRSESTKAQPPKSRLSDAISGTWTTIHAATTLLTPIRFRTNDRRGEETKDEQPTRTNRQLLRDATQRLSEKLSDEKTAVLRDNYTYLLGAAAKVLDPLFGCEFLLMSVSSDSDLNKLLNCDFVFRQTKPSTEEWKDLLSASINEGIYLRILSNTHESTFSNELLYVSQETKKPTPEFFTESQLKEIEFVSSTVAIAKTTNSPILIRQDETYYVYASFDKKPWELTRLNAVETSRYILPFPDQSDMETDGVRLPYNGATYEGLYQHIASQTMPSLTINDDEDTFLLEQINRADAELDYYQMKALIRQTIDSPILDGSDELYHLINTIEEELSEIESTIERTDFVLQTSDNPPIDDAITNNKVYLYLNADQKVEYAIRYKSTFSTRSDDPGYVIRKQLRYAIQELPYNHGISLYLLLDLRRKLPNHCLLTKTQETTLFSILKQIEKITQKELTTSAIQKSVETIKTLNETLQHRINVHNTEIKKQRHEEARINAQLQIDQKPLLDEARQKYRSLKAQYETHPEIDYRATKLLCELLLERPNSGRITFSVNDIMRIIEQIDTPYVPPPIAVYSPHQNIKYSIVFAGLVLLTASALLIVLSHGLSTPISYMGMTLATDMILSAVFCTTMAGAVTCNVGMFCGSRKKPEVQNEIDINLTRPMVA